MTGCGPKYVIKKSYHSLSASNWCIQSCQERLESCEKRLRLEYDNCLKLAQIRAKESYYNGLELYKRELKDYKKSLIQLQKVFDSYSLASSRLCTCKDENDKKLLRALQAIKPIAPKPLELEKITSYTILGCKLSSRCEVGFEACFSACGDKIEMHRFCISGCN